MENFAPNAHVRYFGRVPVRNIWVLMLYASSLFPYLMKKRGKYSVEENPDDIPDLVAEFLAALVEDRLLRNLSCSYIPKRIVLGKVRGKIDFLYTKQNRLLEKGLIACNIEELSADTPRNRYVKAALEHCSSQVKSRCLSLRCRKLASQLYRLGVIGDKPSKSTLSADRYGQHDRHDKGMMSAATLAFDLALPQEAAGQYALLGADAETRFIRCLYEKAVAGFYAAVAPHLGWQVSPGAWQDWRLSGSSGGIARVMPKMQLDVMLQHKLTNRRIIIDTKFNSLTVKGFFREETLRSQYIYQMYAYLRSQENADDISSISSEGILLHPSIDEKQVSEYATIQGHHIRFATVDLGRKASVIRERLLSFLGDPRGWH